MGDRERKMKDIGEVRRNNVRMLGNEGGVIVMEFCVESLRIKRFWGVEGMW